MVSSEMIVVSIELWPNGFPEHKKLLGRMVIVNDMKTSSKDSSLGSYRALATRSNLKREWRNTYVHNFKRKRYSVWHLLTGVLNMMIGSELGKSFRNFEEQIRTNSYPSLQEQAHVPGR